MFSDKPTRVSCFGKWADETDHIFRAREALAVVDRVLLDCRDEDLVDDEELIMALGYLERLTGKRGPCISFRLALRIENQDMRFNAAYRSREGIARLMPTEL